MKTSALLAVDSTPVFTSGPPELLQLLRNLTVFLTPHSRIQNSGVAGVQELKNLDSGGDFPGEMPVPDFRIKTLLAYSATPDSWVLIPDFFSETWRWPPSESFFVHAR